MRSVLAFIILFFLFLFAAPIAEAQRGFVAVPVKEKAGTHDVTLYQHSYALVIGIDRYTNGWPVLGGAVSDAEAVAAELKARFGVSNVELLTSKTQTLDKDTLTRAISRFLLDPKHSRPDARLVIWFAGHGHSVLIPGTADEHIAYIVGADAPLPPTRPEDDYEADAAFQDKALPLSQFDIWMRQTRAKHVLATFDSCFSGGIFAKRAVNHNYVIERATTLQVRQFISSGQAGQEVSDDGQFRKRFLDAIVGRDPRADQNRDGYILGSELGQYLYQKITASSYGRQTPKYGALPRAPFDRGDFVFKIPDSSNGVPEAKPVPRAPDPQIKRIQQWLTSLGYDVGSADGLMGDTTRAAIRAYQLAKGLPADGQVSIGLVFRLSDDVRGGSGKLAFARPQQPQVPSSPVRPAVGIYPTPPRLTPGTSFNDCHSAGWCPEMVVVPAGSFVMGSPDSEKGRDEDEGPQHGVTIAKPFAVGKYEVTWDQWEVCVRGGGCDESEVKKAGDEEGWGKGDRPVINVSWHDAQAYVKWLSRKTGEPYRLLAEAEWEYAARAGTTGPFSFTGRISTDKANYDGNYTYDGSAKGTYRQKTVAVNSFKPNAFGLYNVHGNVWEWVEDCYHDNYKGAPSEGRADTAGSCEERVLRGGAWDGVPGFLRAAVRDGIRPGFRVDGFGFRVARSLSPASRR